MQDAGVDQPQDESLVREARRGNVRAFESLLERHQGAVLRLLRLLRVPAQDREDVAQDIFIRVFRHLGGFRDGAPFRPWLYRVTVNSAHDYRGRRGRTSRAEAQLPEAWETVDPYADASRGARESELRRALWCAMEILSERERAVFVLRELEGVATSEVAGILGVSSITVRRHLGRARRRLRGALADPTMAKKGPSLVERPLPDGGNN